jgi:heme/copper-type cytochrome/quinol oxidase subunit 3
MISRGRVGMGALIAAEASLFAVFVVAYLYAGIRLGGNPRRDRRRDRDGDPCPRLRADRAAKPDALAGQFLAAHMTQHRVLMMVAPPLL